MTFDKDLTTPILPTEEWRDIPGYEGSYQVSNLGRVKSLDRECLDSWGRIIHLKGKFLKQHIHKGKYLYVYIHKWYSVHSLVMLTFVGDRPKGMHIDHINTISFDNRVSNLRYCTAKENCNNPLTIEKYKARAKDLSNKVTLQFDLEGNYIRSWKRAKDAARELKISYGHLCDCARGLRKSSGGYIWKYQQQ